MRSKRAPRATNRVAFCLLPLLLAACSEAQSDDPPAGPMVACALAGAAEFSAECTMERVAGPDGTQLIVRHPDGGFRRFDLGVPGRGIVTADGADQAVVHLGEGMAEVTVGEDRYRLPIAQ